MTWAIKQYLAVNRKSGYFSFPACLFFLSIDFVCFIDSSWLICPEGETCFFLAKSKNKIFFSVQKMCKEGGLGGGVGEDGDRVG